MEMSPEAKNSLSMIVVSEVRDSGHHGFSKFRYFCVFISRQSPLIARDAPLIL